MNIIELKKLPKIPDDLIPGLIQSAESIGVDPKLESYNKFRQDMNRAAFITPEVVQWINENIYNRYFTEDQIRDTVNLNNNLINVTSYIESASGKHPIHVDISRNYALNYYIDTGGNNTRVTWFAPDRKTVVYESEPIKPNTWYLLKVRPELHEVSGIKTNMTRFFLTLGFHTEILRDFNEESFFHSLLSDDK